MKVLIYKDFLAIRTQLLLTLVLLSIILVCLIGKGHYVAIPFGITLLCYVLSLKTFADDEQCGFLKFAFSGPVTRQDYVLSKYIPWVVLGIFGGFITALLSVLLLTNPLDQSLFYGACAAVLPFSVIGLMFPFIFKLGAEKGRYVTVAIFFLLFTLMATGQTLLANTIAWIQSLPVMTFAQVGLICLSAGILFTTVSVFISIHIVQNKEY